MAERFVMPIQSAYDASGLPLAAGKLYFFESGTSTPVTTYRDNALTIENLNPVPADPSGRFGDIFLAVDTYKIVLDDALDNNIFTADPYTITQSLTAGPGLEDASGVRRTTVLVNAQTGTSYTILTGDRAKLVTHINASAIAVTLPQADLSDFASGWYYNTQNRGAGTLTITPITSTIDGAATLVLKQGDGVLIVSDGTNYFTQRGITPINTLTGITSLDDVDQFLVADNSDSDNNKKILWSDIRATQAEQELGSATNKAVTSGTQHYHNSAAKAWVNFNGQGTIAIRSSYNVTSLTDNGLGDYTVNLTNSMSDTNFVATVTTNAESGVKINIGCLYPDNVTSGNPLTTSSVRIIGMPTGDGGGKVDMEFVMCTVFGDQ